VVSSVASRDAELVQLARAGDQAAFGVLVARHRPMALRVCRRLLLDHAQAEDGVQEAVLLAWLNLDKLRRPDRFGAWLAGIALRACHAWLRYRTREVWSLEMLPGGRLLPEPVDRAATPAQTFEEAELAERVRRAVADLPQGQRAAVALFYLAGLSHAETAALLRIEVGAVKARLHKARGRLRRSLWELWKEQHMTTSTASEFIRVQVEDVRAVPTGQPSGERRVVLLAEVDGERRLPIWVGPFEGDAIAILLVRAEAPRPLTFPFAAQLLEAAGARLGEVRIHRLSDETFYAQAVVETSGGTHTVDARPSDAIALALETGAPIRIATAVMDQAGMEPTRLKESRPPESRSAREHADEIRDLLAQPRGKWPRPMLF
jgi:RNA polymerase sigma factor (sigma-70 family)